MRGCNYSVCPDSNVCEPDATEPSGYVCTGCQDGFMIVDTKCIGKKSLVMAVIYKLDSCFIDDLSPQKSLLCHD